ncbi:MAG TPA: branched-chain amino acid ABC transporter permease [Acidimicrobiales bacterium]|nr:branched-chain amino acid ABC transporter permease [Acidimicrobiales bacterium]
MNQFFQQFANGLVLGSTYALIALGYTMVYGIIQLINFAHGEIFMMGAFGGLATHAWIVPDGAPAALALLMVLVGAILTSVATAVLMERLAYRPLRNAPRLAPLITAIGVSIVLQEGIRLFYPGAKTARPFPRLISGENLHLGEITIARVSIVQVLTAVVLTVGLTLFIRRTRTGKAMRATAEDPQTAQLMGINVDRIIVITFVLGAALAAVAGVLQGMRFGQIDFRMGFLMGIKAFTAAVLGGIGNVAGAVLGGFMLGLVEVLATEYLPLGSAWKDVWAFVVLIGILVFRPSGLLGERVAARA